MVLEGVLTENVVGHDTEFHGLASRRGKLLLVSGVFFRKRGPFPATRDLVHRVFVI